MTGSVYLLDLRSNAIQYDFCYMFALLFYCIVTITFTFQLILSWVVQYFYSWFILTGMLMANMCWSGVIPSLLNGVLSFCYTTERLFDFPYMCIASAIISNANQLVTLTSIAAMSIDRLISVSIPFRYEQLVTTTKVSIFIGIQVRHVH